MDLSATGCFKKNLPVLELDKGNPKGRIHSKVEFMLVEFLVLLYVCDP